jgi:hypothetical protein
MINNRLILIAKKRGSKNSLLVLQQTQLNENRTFNKERITNKAIRFT